MLAYLLALLYICYENSFVLTEYGDTIQYNTIQCESLVGQVAHPIFFICGRASLLVGAFTQVSMVQLDCWLLCVWALIAVGL